ncbi:conserved exported hypothetical protein [Vibrio chagasii]|uniref:hypothetical protein n=1 Tax=unclassified Vibrio TaxID=2614977 RepID=UPI001493B361|nr:MULTISPECIES: hypothetical protein [unclassified Vibrio]CAH6794205.1 conserved exported hypothetical protein [Vibrio chagasii]NOI37614.1 hypothetical protein [Vibrio sp. 070316B]NOI86115.1 hypothetical protein [Vibrio sp. 99K-1]CAH6804390.1 conserved exported hypothetical protein [Vibrio chagasii]CAH6808311.1 conserved exported hypothetical protein [Vibrio chagasii]
MKKVSILAAAIAVALTGCGSDSSSVTTPTETSTTNKFIDAAVEGIYYSTSSGLNGVTTSEGEFTAKTSDTITFFIGGENGLKVGAASNRDVLTPFEAAGKYARALNLAILLQSLDNQFGNTSDEILTIPDMLREPDAATLTKMKDLSLDDTTSVTDFLVAVGVEAANIASENDALTHMQSAFGSMERGDDSANPFITAGKFVRYIDVTQNSNEFIYVHADKLMEEDMFERTRGMTEMTFKVNSAESVTTLAGSNDYSLSESFAEQYLTCVADSTNQWIDEKEPERSGCDIDGDDQIDLENGDLNPDSAFVLNSAFAYKLRDLAKSATADEEFTAEDIEGWKPFDVQKASDLNHYTANNVWDDKDEDSNTSNWIRDTTSGSFDPVTGIYSEIVKKETLGSDANNPQPRVTERVAYYYEIPTKDSERYVDFTGTWETKEYCDNGEVAVSTMVFGATKVTTSGSECGSENDGQSSPEDMGQFDATYAELGAIDYWWFGQTDRASKATLTELNTVVRFCDQDDFDPDSSIPEDNTCDSKNEYFVKWEYQPAGTNWDEGLLIRRKMDNQGDTNGRVSIMQKIN